MQARRSTGSARHSIGDREGLIRAYDEEAAGFGLTDLAEDSDGDDGLGRPNGRANGQKREEDIELQGR